jgi:hypothetical protein
VAQAAQGKDGDILQRGIEGAGLGVAVDDQGVHGGVSREAVAMDA